MIIKQLSVFIENREGRLEQVTEILRNSNINIVSLSLADTSEYGVFRLIVSDPEFGKKVLKEAGFSAMLTDVLAVKLPHRIGILNELLETLVESDIGVEYMYTLATGMNASIVMKLSDIPKGYQVLKDKNYDYFPAEEVYKINNETTD